MMSILQDHSNAAAASVSDSFREAMRELASGVGIVTAGRDSEWAGMTVTSVTSLSLDPPTILVCINRSSSIVPFLERYWHFAVSFLSADQHTLAERFAGRGGFQGLERFQAGNWTTHVSGSPVLASAPATIDCKLEEMIPRHSHLIVVGRVLAVKVEAKSEPILYWRGDFARLQPLEAD